MADKKLTISVEGKIGASVQQLTKLMDDFAARGNKMARAVNSVAGLSDDGKGTAATGGLAKALLKEKKLFDDLGKSGERFAKVLNDQVARSQTALRKQLEDSSKSLDVLVKKHEKAQARVEQLKREGDPERIELARRYAQRANIAMYQGASEALALRQAADALEEQQDGGDQKRGGQVAQTVMGALMGKAGIPFGGSVMALGGSAAVVAAAAAGVAVGTKMVMSNMAAPTLAAGELGAAQATEYSMLAGFNMRQLYGRQKIELGQGGADLLYKDDLSKLWHGIKAAGRAGVALVGGEGMEGAREVIGAERKSWEAGIIQRRNERAIPISAEEEATFQRAEQQKQLFRATWRHGQGIRKSINTISESTGLDPLEVLGYAGNLSTMTGAWAAGGYAGRVASAVRSGMTPGAATQIVGQTAVAGGNPLGYTGSFDPAIREIIGQTIASTMGANTMMFARAGDALADSLAGGMTTTGGPVGMRQAQQVAMGAGIYQKAFAGHDPFQKSYNIAAASAALGPGASSYTRNFLATQMADPKVLSAIMAGQLPSDFKNMNISLQQAQRAARDIDRGLVGSRWFDTGEKSIAAQRMREIRQAGGPIAWGAKLRSLSPMEREQRIQEAAPLLSQVEMGLTGGEVGAGQAMLRRAAGLGTPASRHTRGRGAGAPVTPDEWTEGMERMMRSESSALRSTVTNTIDGLHKFNEMTKTVTGGLKSLDDRVKQTLGGPGGSATSKPRGK